MKLKKIFIYVGVLTTFLFIFGCEKPAASVETPVEVVEETVVEDPAPVVEEPEEGELVEVKEEPQFILYNEDGSFYEPMHVTLEDFYSKVDDAEKEYFQAKEGKESSYKVWQRDRYVALLLAYNSPYMNEEDVITIYDDYLANFGWNAVSDAYSGLGEKVKDTRKGKEIISLPVCMSMCAQTGTSHHTHTLHTQAMFPFNML